MNRESILDILDELGAENVIPYKKNVQCSCLLAKWRGGHSFGSDHAGSMGISIDSEGVSLVHCFSCGIRSTLERTVHLLGKYSEKDLSNIIQRISVIEEPDVEDVVNSIPAYTTTGEQLSLLMVEKPKILGECLLRMLFVPGVHKYLINRGFDIDTLKTWECYLDRFRKRVVFPVRTKTSDKMSGNLVGAVGRTVTDSNVKYFNYFKFNKSRVLYGEHRVNQSKAVVVVEGILDTLAVWKALKDADKLDDFSVVGLLGANASEYQSSMLHKKFEEIILFLDNDPAGWTGQRALAKALQRKMLVRAVRYPQRFIGDPENLIRKNIDVVSMIVNADLIVI